jgi:uncharacterized membrane protein
MPVKRSGDDQLEQSEFNPSVLVSGMALDLKLVLAFILVAVLVIYLPFVSETMARPAVGILMLLFVPGYSLIAALFPGKSDLGRMERVALSLGLSIAVSSLIGLALNYTPWGIRIDPLVICLSVFAIICVSIANMRRHVTSEGERFTMTRGSISRSIRGYLFHESESRLDRALSIMLVAVVIVSIALTIYVISVPKHGEVFTEFYILSSSDRSDNYPVQYYVGETKPIVIGVVNHEYRNVTYDLRVTLGDVANLTTLYAGNLTLVGEQRWEQKVNLTPDRIGTDMRMDFLLYADGNMTSPYRDLHLWVNVTDMEMDSVSPGELAG